MRLKTVRIQIILEFVAIAALSHEQLLSDPNGGSTHSDEKGVGVQHKGRESPYIGGNAESIAQ